MQSKAPLPNAAPQGKAPRDVKAEDKRLAVQFKAQHGLIVAFFILILYAGDCLLKPAFRAAISH
jgi:phosphatidylinositol glycan class O